MFRTGCGVGANYYSPPGEMGTSPNLECLPTCHLCKCVLFFSQDGVSPDFEEHSTILGSGTVPFQSLPLGKDVAMTVPVGKVPATVSSQTIFGGLKGKICL